MGERPLVGVRVLELAQGIAGPYGGKLLLDLGAEVIKAEPPAGDSIRTRGPFRNGKPDPEASGFFLYLNAGKSGLTLDLERPDGRAALSALAERVDVVIESCAPGELDRLGVGFESLQDHNPRLVMVSATPFGQWGPRSAWRGDDLIAFHSSGFAHGFPSPEVDSPDLPPLNAPSHAASFLAGEMVAGAVIHGLLAAQQTGRGSHLDVSLQEAVAAENQSQHSALERDGAYNRKFAGSPSNATVALLPCRDGWVAISPREEHQWARWLEVMGGPDWADDARFADRRARQSNWQELYPLLAAWSRERSKLAIFEACQVRRVACYPLGTVTDLLESPQLASRGFFVEQEHPTLGPLILPGVPYHLAGAERASARRAPRLGEHNREIYGALLGFDARTSAGGSGSHAVPGAEPRSIDERAVVPRLRDHGEPGQADEAAVRPLLGTRVVDFSWVMAGPICTKYLAALGAEVIKIESRARPDLSHRDTSWEELNPSKRSITLNLKDERARDLARRLIALSDIVLENFSTGVMERLGLGYPTLRELNPHLIMASASGFGRAGPARDWVAYGSLLQCFTGWASLSAHPGRPPRSAGGIWTDPLTATLETFLLLAALWRQRASGEGCFFDLSMAETTLAALPEPILAWTMSGEVLEPRGNRDSLVAPRGCYPAAGDDRWIALSVQRDAEWVTLARLMAREDLLADSDLSTVAGRRAHHDELDLAIAAWTRERPAPQTAAALQAAGIAATPTLTPADVLHDEHLAARDFVAAVERLGGGTRWTLGVPWMIDGRRPNDFRRAPQIGEDNGYVLMSLLGLDETEYERLVAEQVIY